VLYRKPVQNTDFVFTWTQTPTSEFDELIISWNALRPKQGEYVISVSVLSLEQGWSDWHVYARWGAEGQHGGHTHCADHSLRIFQDTVELLEGKYATGFRIRVTASHGAALSDFYFLHANTTDSKNRSYEAGTTAQADIELKLPSISQIALFHPRRYDLCSPTSTTSVVNYLLKGKSTDCNPIQFASQIHDQSFDIFGNWVLNTAEAASLLGKQWHCWVQRLKGFDEIYRQLTKGYPVITSIRGPLKGSAAPYERGHLIAIRGYDAQNCRVLCMDPAFPSDAETNVSYALPDFLEAWTRRGRVAYLFEQSALIDNK